MSGRGTKRAAKEAFDDAAAQGKPAKKRAADVKSTKKTSKASSPKNQNAFLKAYTEKVKVTIDGKKRTLIVTVNVQEHGFFDAVKRLDVDIHLATPGVGTEEIGYLVGWHADKTEPSPAKEPGWVHELLIGLGRYDPTETLELRTVVEEVYKKNGEPKAKVDLYKNDLTLCNLVFLDTLVLDEEYRGKGMAQEVVQCFHRLVRKIINSKASADTPLATLLLSPAKSSEVEWDNGESEVEVERGLIKSYQKSNYAVWIKGPEKKEGSVTVMGRVV